MDDTILRELQLVEHDMLQDIVRVCNKYGIRYYLICGTLLGAVRHKGFIPWDDDIDIAMFYPDYLRFWEVAQEELGEDYFVQSSETDPAWFKAFTRVRKNGTTMSNRHMLKGSSMHQGIWVDIFPLAWMNSMREIKRKNIALQIVLFLAMDEYLSITTEDIKSKFGCFWPFLKLLYRIPEKTRKKWRKGITKYVLGGKSDAKYVITIVTKITNRDIYPKKTFIGSPSTVEFENCKYNAPSDIKLALVSNYGDNYMVPIREDKVENHSEYIIDCKKDYLEYKLEMNQ